MTAIDMSSIIPTTEITFIRHCKVDGPAALYGKTDIAAEQTQNQQVCQQVYDCFQNTIDVVISSPLQRCYQLASELAELADWPIDIFTDFREMDFGEFDGVAFEHLGEQWQLLAPFWQDPAKFRFESGESLQQFHQRVVNGWQTLIEKYAGQKILVISHGGVIRLLVAHLLELNWQNPRLYSNLSIEYASATKVTLLHEQQQHAQINFIGAPLFKSTT